jgi:hypothetical protein
MPVVPVQFIGANVADQHSFTRPRLALEANPERATNEAAAAVGSHHILNGYTLFNARTGESRSDAVSILIEARQLSTEFHMTAGLCQAISQDGFHPELRDDHRAGVGNIGRWQAPFMHIAIEQNFRTFVSAKRQMKASTGEDFIDFPEIVEYFQAARLKAFPSRTSEVFLHLIDDPKSYSTASQIASQSKTGGPSTHYENRGIHGHA